MAIFNQQVLSNCCLSLQGDIGPLTTYTTRRKIVVFNKVWLSDPTTIRQLNHRNRVRAAAELWRRLPIIEKAKWEKATRKLCLKLNGYNLWVSWQMTRNPNRIATIERQSGITLMKEPPQ